MRTFKQFLNEASPADMKKLSKHHFDVTNEIKQQLGGSTDCEMTIYSMKDGEGYVGVQVDETFEDGNFYLKMADLAVLNALRKFVPRVIVNRDKVRRPKAAERAMGDPTMIEYSFRRGPK